MGIADGAAGIADVDAGDARGCKKGIDLAVGLWRIGHGELGKLPEGLNILGGILAGDEHDGQRLAVARQFALATHIPQLLHLGQLGTRFDRCLLEEVDFADCNLKKAVFNNRLSHAKFSRYGVEGLLAAYKIEIV